MRWSPLLIAIAISACGGEPVLLVEVDLSNYTVPDEVDLIHLELRDGDAVLGRNFPLDSGEQQPLFELLVGSRTPAEVALTAYAYLGGGLVSQSEPFEVAVADREEPVRLVVP